MLIERTSYHPKPDMFDQVLALRHKACKVRREIGLKAGDVYVESPVGAEGDVSDGRIVHWECRFASEDAQAEDLAKRGESDDFRRVRAEMGELIGSFRRALIREAQPPGSRLTETALDGIEIVPTEVTFESEGLELAGFLYIPPGAGPFPCMVMNHGSSISQGSTDLCRPGVASMLMSWGIAAFLPHRRGYGNSPGTPWREDVSADYGTEDYDRQLAERLYNESTDVISALSYVKGLDAIDADHVGVTGSSFGGTVTLLAASREPGFRCAVEFAGAAMNWERTPGLRKLMHDAAAKLTQPIFFIQAANDYSVRPTIELAEGLAGTDKIVRSHVYPSLGLSKDEGHFFYRDGTRFWGGDVRAFLQEWL